MGARPSGGGGVRDAVFKHGIDLQMRIMERLGYMTGAARSDNLCIPLETEFRDIFLHFLSKADCIRSCTRSHTPVRVHNRDSVI